MKSNTQFYFDFLSPYSYFAWLSIKDSLIDIELSPVLMGKLFSHFEFKGPGEIPPKRIHELKKCFRIANRDKIQFIPPTQHPFNPILIARMATKHAAGPEQRLVIDQIFKLIWAKGEVLEDPERVAKLIPASDQLIEKSFERAAKLELKTNINQAIENNVFGVPSILIDKEVFWGYDSIPFFEQYMKGTDNYNKQLFKSLTL